MLYPGPSFKDRRGEINASFWFVDGENAGGCVYTAETDLQKLIDEAIKHVSGEKHRCAIRILQGKYGWLTGDTVVHCVAPWETRAIVTSTWEDYCLHYDGMLRKHNPSKEYLWPTELKVLSLP